jgi:hypothetical protein
MRILIVVLLAASATLPACSPGEPEPDPVALDRTLNHLIASQEAERARLVEEARVREEIRAREMEQRRAIYQQRNGVAEPAENVSSNAQ